MIQPARLRELHVPYFYCVEGQTATHALDSVTRLERETQTIADRGEHQTGDLFEQRRDAGPLVHASLIYCHLLTRWKD